MVISNPILHQSIHLHIHINNTKIQLNKTIKLTTINPIHIQ
jgi:hypothetical protein